MNALMVAAQGAAARLMEIARLAEAIQELSLSDEHTIELETQLRNRISQVVDSLSEFTLVRGAGGLGGGFGLSRSQEQMVEVGVDVHESSPLSSGPEAATSADPASTVAETAYTSSIGVGAAERCHCAPSATYLATRDLVALLREQLDGYESDEAAAADWARVVGTKYDAQRIIARVRIASGRAA